MSELELVEDATAKAAFRAASSWAAPRRLAPRPRRSRPCWRAPTRSPPTRRGRAASLRLGLGGGSTTDSIDVTSYNDFVMIDVEPRPVQRPRRMGPGRQAAAGAGRELRAEERREGLDLQPPQGHQILRTARNSTPTTRSIRSICIAATPSPAAPASMKASHGRQEARQVSDPDFARRAPTPIFPMS